MCGFKVGDLVELKDEYAMKIMGRTVKRTV